MSSTLETDFLNKVNRDAALMQKLRAATDADGVVAIANEAGFGALEESIRATVTKRLEAIEVVRNKISDEELELFFGRLGLNCCTQTSVYSNVTIDLL